MLGRQYGGTVPKQAQLGMKLLDQDTFGGYDMNPMTGMPFANTIRRSPKASRPP